MNKYDSIEGFEELDVRFYALHLNKDTKTPYAYWELVGNAKEITLSGFENFKLFMSKYENDKGDSITKISEALSGHSIYKSSITESKAKTIENCLIHLKSKKITEKKLTKLILDKINKYGVSKKYRP